MKRKSLIESIDKSITKFYEKISAWEESVASQVHLTPRQCHAVAELGESGPSRMKPLSERLEVTTGTLTVMIDRLERAGLVTRNDDPDDKRACLLTLTEEGGSVYKEHLRHHNRLAREFAVALTQSESEELILILDKLNSVL